MRVRNGADDDGIFVKKGVPNPLPEARLLVPSPSLPGHLGRRGCTGRGNDQAGGLGRAGEPLIVGNEYRQLVVEQHG